MRTLLAFALGISFLTCNDSPDQKAKNVTALEYELISFTEIDSIPESKITFILKDLAFSGQGPVNRYFGKITDSRITSPIGSTMMAGPENLMQFEQKYLAALESAIISGVGGDTLRIISPDSIQMVFVLKKD